MKRKSIQTIHRSAGIAALFLILSFFIGSVYTEITGSLAEVIQVKKSILYGIGLLMFLMPIAAGSGKKLAGKSKHALVTGKNKRMKWIALNGILLVGLAVTLYIRSAYYTLDTVFWILQIAEYFFGLLNITLLCLMVRNGLALSGKLKIAKKQSHLSSNATNLPSTKKTSSEQV